jgi:hypothetical protein
MTDYRAILERLNESGVDFIVIGGLAALAHGSARFTQDVDVVYRRTPENYARLVEALTPLNPYLRGAPPGLPFRWNKETIRHGLNFTLTSTLGDLDLLGEVAGGGGYDQLLPASEFFEPYGVRCRVVSLDKLIDLKRAAGRVKDLEAIAELEALAEEIAKSPHKPPSPPDPS